MRARAARIEAGKSDFNTATPQQREARLRDLGTGEDLIQGMRLPVVPVLYDPKPDTRSGKQIAEAAHTASAKARASAEVELTQAELEARQQNISIDVRRLSPLAFRLYKQRKGLTAE